MRITGTTRVIGIFGDPVEHTLSPAIQNAAFEFHGLDIIYVPFHVKPAALKGAVSSIRALDIPGMNITIPHKEKVIRLLDEVDETAIAIGAVNTIVNRGGRLKGYNTDGAGYLASLREETGFVPKGKKIVIIGAGGAARAIVYSILRQRPSAVTLLNRTVKRAESLADEFRPMSISRGIRIHTGGTGPDDLDRYSPEADLIINTTSLGMMDKGAIELPFRDLRNSAIVSDIVYRPLKTGLIRKAEAQGLKVHTGLGMLIHQGAIGFELWTGKKAPIDVMRRAALKGLGRR